MIINNLSIIFSSGKSSESRSIDYFQSISTVLHVENTALQTGDSHKGSYMPNKRVIMPAITFFPPLRKTGSKCELYAPMFNISDRPQSSCCIKPCLCMPNGGNNGKPKEPPLHTVTWMFHNE